MKIIRAYPPNFVAIRTAFPQVVGRQGILYAWGDRVYNPSGVNVPWWLHEHEETHGKRQLAGTVLRHGEDSPVNAWWDRYIRDATFRLEEEIPAHQAEWRVFKSIKLNHKDQKTYLASMAQRLSGPLYNNMISLADAIKEITT